MTETPAKKPFDAEMHKFGMAYTIEDDHLNSGIFYPFGDIEDNWSSAANKTDIGDIDNGVRVDVLIRAPEHDLIPRKDVDALIEALTWAIGGCEHLRMSIPKTDNLLDHNRLEKTIAAGRKALSEFQSKHGGRDV